MPQLFPVPTPYQSPQYGGNQYVTPGTTGQSISKADYPIATMVDGSIRWASGKITPPQSVSLPKANNQRTTTQQQPLQPQPQPGGGDVPGGMTREQLWRELGNTGDVPVGWNGLGEQAPAAPTIDYDALIAPALQALEESIAGFTTANQDIISGIQSGAETQKASAQQSFGEQQQTLERAKTTQQQQAEAAIGEQEKLRASAADEARRQAAELQQGIQARYGGTMGTSRFISEILGSQATRNISGINTTAAKQISDFRQNLATAIQTIDDKMQQVQEIGRIAEQDIDANTQQQVAQARQQLEENLASIRSQQSNIQMNKVQMAQQAMQAYQQTVADVNARNTAFKQQLYMQQQQAQQQLELARQKAQTAASNVPDFKYDVLNLGGNRGEALIRYSPSSGTAESIFSGAPGGLTGNVTDPIQQLISSGLATDEETASALLR